MKNIENKINAFGFAQEYREKVRLGEDSQEKEDFKKLLAEGEVFKEVVQTLAEQVLLSVSVNDYFNSDFEFPSDVARSMFDKAIRYISNEYGSLQEYDKEKIRKSMYRNFMDDILKDLKWDLVTFTNHDWQELQGKYVGASILDRITLRETAYRKLNDWLLETKKEDCINGIAELINQDNIKKIKKLEEELEYSNRQLEQVRSIV